MKLYWCALCKKFLGEEKAPNRFYGTYVNGRPEPVCESCHDVLMQKNWRI